MKLQSAARLKKRSRNPGGGKSKNTFTFGQCGGRQLLHVGHNQRILLNAMLVAERQNDV
jgi:hypothetical protein